MSPATALNAIRGYLQAGGAVVVALLISTFAMWVLILERLFYLAFTQKRLAAGRIRKWNNRRDHSSWYAHVIRERLISEQRLDSEQYLGAIRILVLVTPLLGLLGTVTGMIEVFQVIIATDSSNARLMAEGIYRATIPTMTGLAVSLSGIFVLNILERRTARMVAQLADSLEVHGSGKSA